MIAFSYDKPTIATGGWVTVDDTRVTAAGSFTKSLAPDESVSIVVKSGNPGAYTSSIFISDIRLLNDKLTTVTFTPAATGGSYKVNGTTVTAEQSVTQNSLTAYELTAVPDNGYKLLGWYGSVDGYLSDKTVYSARLDSDQTVTAVFTLSDNPVFDVAGNLFDDLTEAIDYSVSANSEVIRLRSGGTLPAGTYKVSVQGFFRVRPYPHLSLMHNSPWKHTLYKNRQYKAQAIFSLNNDRTFAAFSYY